MNRCTSCARAGPDVGSCGNTMTCPGTSRPVEVGKEIVLHCAVCDKTRVVSAPSMIRGKGLSLELVCPRGEDTCQIRAMPPPTPAGQGAGNRKDAPTKK